MNRRTLLTTLASLPLLGWGKTEVKPPAPSLPPFGSPWPGNGRMWGKTLMAIAPGCRGEALICNSRGEPTELRASVINGFTCGVDTAKRIVAVGGKGKWIIVLAEC